jgi:ABC-type transport system substrate-binding protein
VEIDDLKEESMMKKQMLGSLAAAVLSLALLPAQAALTATAGDAGTVLGGTAISVGSFLFDANQSLGGGDFNLTSMDPGALFFLPDLSSIGGQSFSALCAMAVCSGSSDSPGISVILPLPVTVPGGVPVPVVLAFRGDVVGVHPMTYTLTLYDGPLETEFLASGGFNVTVSPVPEPATYALMLGGLAAVGALARRRSLAA